MEILDIVDENGLPTGRTVERSVAHAEGIHHRTAHVWVTRDIDGRKQILLQKRAMCKESFPGRYDTSSAGHITAGDEPLESAIRELGEELGIKAEPEDFEKAGTFLINYSKEFGGKMFRDCETANVFIYNGDVDINSLTLQAEEVERVDWFFLDEVYAESMKHNQKFCVPVDGLRVLMKYFGITPEE